MTKDIALRDELFADIGANMEKYTAVAKDLWDHPEIALEEVESSKKLVKVLEDAGFEVEYPYAGLATAFKATKKNGEGPRIAYLAEYDALPEVGHACGHCWIASTSVAAGITLAKALDKYPGEVTVFGTPAEETGDGKPTMVDFGAFEGYDAALEFHGNYTTCLAPDMIAIGGIDIHFKGVASHAGAAPYNGVNALDAVIIFFTAINALRQQLRDGTRIHGIIVEAGKAVNVVPDEGTIRLEIRNRDTAYFNEVLEKVVNCAKAAALATGCEMTWEHFEPTVEGVNSNPKLREMMLEITSDYPEFEEGDDNFSGGGSDIGNVSQVIPTLHPMLKIVDNGAGLHTEEFRDALFTPYALERCEDVIKVMTELGLRLLEDPELTASLSVD